jgi:hypothetical protein
VNNQGFLECPVRQGQTRIKAEGKWVRFGTNPKPFTNRPPFYFV